MKLGQSSDELGVDITYYEEESGKRGEIFVAGKKIPQKKMQNDKERYPLLMRL